MHTTPNWKNDLSDLRNRARAVLDEPSESLHMSPRATARCLSGVVGLVARQWSVDVMQRACADLVRCDAAWKTGFGTLPRENGYVPPAIEMIAVVARGIISLAGADSMRAALSFWATEDDPAAWQTVSGIAA